MILRCRCVLLSLILVLPFSGARGATVRSMTLDALIQRSDYVVYGRVLTNRSIYDANTSSIWTETELLVLDGPKGRVGSTILITEPGGVIGNNGQLFPGVPKFEVNQEIVVFLHNAPGNVHRVTGLQQGVYRVTVDRDTRQKLAEPTVKQAEPVYEEGRFAAPQRLPIAAQRLDDFLNSIRRKASPQ